MCQILLPQLQHAEMTTEPEKILKNIWATPKEERTVGGVQESRACAVSSKVPWGFRPGD